MHPSRLPSNTLLLTLSPPGETFYLPAYHPARIPSPSPSVGYSSDPELDVRKVKQSTDAPTVELLNQNDGTSTKSRRQHRVGFQSYGSTEMSKTANWQDLLKFVVKLVKHWFLLMIRQAYNFTIVYPRHRNFAS